MLHKKTKNKVAPGPGPKHCFLTLMPQCRYKFIWLGLLLPAVLGPIRVSSCNVPVFRYALERWTSDPYVAVVFHREPFSSDQQSTLDAIQKPGAGSTANLLLRPTDVSGPMPAPFRDLWQAQPQSTLPWVVVRYPAETGIQASLWTGPLSSDLATNLADSPARRELGRRLLAGDTAIWLLLDSGDRQRDDELASLLNQESRKLAQTLELPKLGPDDPEISALIPLRVAFSTLRVSRSDPAERFLVSQLVRWHPALIAETKAMLFPVFGRGRVLPPAVGEGISAQVIDTMARLLTGPCSCQIKEMNTGFDLLMATDWSRLGQALQTTAGGPPILEGLSKFAQDATNQPARNSLTHPPIEIALAAANARPANGDHLVRNLAVLVGFAVLFLAAATVYLRTKSQRVQD
jgi:hypothetical protein